MMGWTYRHFRYWMRLLAPSSRLYSEMITTGALLHGDRQRWLAADARERPLVLQLGGNQPDALAKCAQYALEYGYDEVNLNVGCPSSRVQSGGIGASLFAHPDVVAASVAAMVAAVDLPISVKCRVAVDENDSLTYLIDFLRTVQQAGCSCVQIHARKAWLSGLNPKQNRTIPPLQYDKAWQASQAVADLPMIINGGIRSVADAKRHLQRFAGVMFGRCAYEQPMVVAQLQRDLYPEQSILSPQAAALEYLDYVQHHLSQGEDIRRLLKPLNAILRSQPNAKKWRQMCAWGADTTSATQRLQQMRELLRSYDPQLQIND